MRGARKKAKKTVEAFQRKSKVETEICKVECVAALSKMKKEELRKLLEERGRPTSGTKEVLLRRLKEEPSDKSEKDASRADEAKEGAGNESVTPMESGLAKRRKKKGTTDPAEIPPFYYDDDLFRANFPLVSVRKFADGVPFPVTDKFDGQKVNAATNRIKRAWLREAAQVSATFADPTSERQSFPHHFSMVAGMSKFALPGPDLLAHLRRICSDVKDVERRLAADTDHEEDEKLVGLKVELAVDDRDLENKGLVVHLKEHGDIPTGFADGIVHVHDERPVKRRRVDTDAGQVPDTERVAAVVERKLTHDGHRFQAVYQGGYYAVQQAMLNLQKGHGTPVYIIVMTGTKWSYAVLVPEGYIQVHDGGVDMCSMEIFRKHQQLTGIVYSDFPGLQKRLTDGMKFYQENFLDNPDAIYRNGPMLVGRLYIRDVWYRLPVSNRNGYMGSATDILFGGLLRLVLGDSVLKFTEEQLLERVNLNDEIQGLLVDAFVQD